MMTPRLLARSAPILLLAAVAPAQAPSMHSVVGIQDQYHFSSYAAEIDIPQGGILLAMEHGSLDVLAGGTFTGSIQVYEWTALGNAAATDTFGGIYFVAPDGQIELDFDPSSPGTDVTKFFVDVGAEVMHHARYDLDPWASSVIAVRKSTGRTNATLTGTYHFYAEYLELIGTQLQTRAERGTATFDGAGNVAVSGTEFAVAPNGTTTTTPLGGTFAYSVAADGAILIDGHPGAVRHDGELFYFAIGGTTSSEVGLGIGVRVGASYDHADLAGRYSLHGRSHVLGAPPLPRCVTDWGELQLAATSTTTGTWNAAGTTVDSTSQAVWSGALNGNGTSALAGNGVLTMTDPGGSIEMAFSASGAYAVGRVLENNTNLFFAMRQAARCDDYGTATPGTGSFGPQLNMNGFPTLGNAAWSWRVFDGRGAAPVILAIAFADAPGLPLFGGSIWIDPATIAATPFTLLGGMAGQRGAGSVALPLAIPSHPAFGNLRFYSQAMILDPAGPGGVAMSNGFLMEISPF